MKHFFNVTFRPFFVVAGAVTTLCGLYALWPRWAVESIQKVAFIQEYTINLQHWGILLALMGIFMIVAAYRVDWRTPILLYSLFEKAFFVYLVLVNASHPYSQGFWLPAAVDFTIVVYTISYFSVIGTHTLPV